MTKVRDNRRLDSSRVATADVMQEQHLALADGRTGWGVEGDAPSSRDDQGARERTSMRNVIVRNVRVRDQDVVWRSVARLRVTIERFEGGEVLAYLKANPACAGHGSSERDAITDVVGEISHELWFHRNVDESELTLDAKRSKTLLMKLFTAATEG